VTRSHAEARATFHRASKDLIPALERDKENDLLELTSDEGEHAEDQAEATAEGDGDGEPTAVIEAAGPADEPVAVVVEEGAALEAGGDPAEELASEGEDDVPPGADQPTRPWFEVVPMSACRREERLSQNEPENRVNVSAQVIDAKASSVDARPAAPGPQNGVPSSTPAVSETPHRPAASPGGEVARGAARTSSHYSAVRRHDPARETGPSRWDTDGTTSLGDGSRNEPENRTVTSAQSLAVKACSVADGWAESSRQTGVPNPARPPAAGNPNSGIRNRTRGS
jgi:hypothetical protein